MELKQALQKAQTDSRINKSDLALINQLQKSINITGLQYDFAVRTLKRYGIVVEEKIQGRRATLRENRIYPFGELRPDELKRLNNIPGAIHYRGETHLPCNHYTIKILKEMKYQLSQNILDWERENSKKDFELHFPEGLALRPYQVEGVKMIAERNGRCLLADQPRLGKTIQVIAYLILHPEIRPALIVVPASIKEQWKREINKWLPGEKCKVVNGLKDSIPDSGIVIINYDILYNYYCDIEDKGFKMLVGDECHKVKNMNSRMSKMFKYLSKGIEHIIGISGTPISNRPSEFFTILSILAPDIFNSHQKYLDEFCNARRDPSGKGSSNPERLNAILKSTIMIRRLRSEVWKDIPEKERIIIPVEIDNREEYNTAERDLIKYLRETKGNRAAQNAVRSEALARFNVLKDIAARGKLKQAIDWIEDFIEAEKLVTICVHRNMVEQLNEHFSKNSVKYYGGMSSKQKDLAVEKFTKDPEIDLFIGNVIAAGVGLPLHIADATLTLELGWVPSDHEQAEDRVISESKKNVPITAYYLVAMNTIEETIAAMIDRKSVVLSKILDGKEVEEESLLTALIEKYSNM